MTMTAELADGRRLEFPDGTDPAVVQRTVKNLLSQAEQPTPAAQPEVTAQPKPGLAHKLASNFFKMGPIGLGVGLTQHASEKFDEALTGAATGAGEKVTDVVSGMGASPEVSAGLGAAATTGVHAASMLVGGNIGTKAAPVLESAGKWLMNNAIKPTLADAKKGNAARAVQTMLDEGINPTKGGVEKMAGKIGDLEVLIQNTLKGNPATVDKASVGSRIQELISKIERTNPTPQDAVRDVEKVYTQFLANKIVPDKIPVEKAQELKRGIYQALKEKYGLPGTDADKAQKALARGFKEEIEVAAPGIKALNAESGALQNALKVSERRALADANKNILSLAPFAHSPGAWAAYMADKSTLFKSLLARSLYSGKEAIPGAAGGLAGLGYSMEKNDLKSSEAMRKKVLEASQQ